MREEGAPLRAVPKKLACSRLQQKRKPTCSWKRARIGGGLSILSPSSLVYSNKNCTTFPRCLIVHYQRSGASKRKFKSDFPRRERSEVLRPSRSPSFLSIHLGHEDRNEATPDRFRRCAPRRGRWGGVASLLLRPRRVFRKLRVGGLQDELIREVVDLIVRVDDGD